MPPPGVYVRLFLAIPLPAYVKEALATLQEGVRHVGWTRPRNMHLTLKFIGEIEHEAVPMISEALADVRLPSFMLPVEGVGRFPPKGPPRVLWAGLGNGHPHLFAQQRKIEDALIPLAIEPEKQIYRPHLTLGRCNEVSEGAARAWLHRHRDFATAPFAVERYVLYRSDRREDGMHYTPLWEQLLPPGVPLSGSS